MLIKIEYSGEYLGGNLALLRDNIIYNGKMLYEFHITYKDDQNNKLSIFPIPKKFDFQCEYGLNSFSDRYLFNPVLLGCIMATKPIVTEIYRIFERYQYEVWTISNDYLSMTKIAYVYCIRGRAIANFIKWFRRKKSGVCTAITTIRALGRQHRIDDYVQRYILEFI